MVEAIVDLTATGTTLRENDLVVREEIVECTARLIANPVAHKLKAAAIDELLGAELRAHPGALERTPEMRDRAADTAPSAERSAARRRRRRSMRALVPGGERGATRRCGEIVARVRAEGDEAVREYTRRFDTAGAEPAAAAWSRAEELDEALKRLALEVVAGCRWRSRTSRWSPQAGVGEDVAVELPQGQRVTLREVPVPAAAVYVPGRARALPEHRRDGRGHRARRRRARRRRVRPARRRRPGRPVILGACRLCGVERVYRMGGAQAIAALAYGTETVRARRVVVGPGNLYVQEAKRQLSARRRHRRVRRARATCWCVFGADAGDASRLAALDLLAQAEHGAGSLVVAVSPLARSARRARAGARAPASPVRPTVGRGGLRARRGARRRARRSSSPTRSPPSTCS